MPSGDFQAALRIEVEDAARRGVPTKEIVEQYKGAVSQASIYIWVKQERGRMADDGRAPVESQPAYPIASLPTVTAIPYLERLNANLEMLDRLMAIAVREGAIQNPKLALDVTRELGVQLSRAARINAEIQDVEAQRRFLRALAEIVHEESPDVRDRIVSKMRAVGATGGVL